MSAENAQESSGGRGEVGATTMSGPESAIMCEAADGNSHQLSALQLFTHTHARHEGQAHALLHKPLNRFNSRELECDVERRVLACKRFDHRSEEHTFEL